MGKRFDVLEQEMRERLDGLWLRRRVVGPAVVAASPSLSAVHSLAFLKERTMDSDQAERQLNTMVENWGPLRLLEIVRKGQAAETSDAVMAGSAALAHEDLIRIVTDTRLLQRQIEATIPPSTKRSLAVSKLHTAMGLLFESLAMTSTSDAQVDPAPSTRT